MKAIITTILIITLVVFLLLTPLVSFAKRKQKESSYQQVWCKQVVGKKEQRLSNGTRIDCLTNSHAIEVDFADKWYEALGQALYYSTESNRKAGIALIIEYPHHEKYYKRLMKTINYKGLKVDVWRIKAY